MIQIFKNIFKKHEPPMADFSGIGIDMHSHLIPGIDDGAKTVEESVMLVKGLMDLGFNAFVTTPHIMPDYYKNSSETIFPGLEQVKAALKAEGLTPHFQAAAEYYIDDLWKGVIAKEPLLTLNEKYVLFEVNYMTRPMNMLDGIFEIKLQNKIPILAHPERYTFMQGKMEEYTKIKDFEVLFQLNVGSLVGFYGPGAQKTALDLIQNNMIDFVGTDTHHIKHVDGFRMALTHPKLKNLIDSGRLMNHTLLKV